MNHESRQGFTLIELLLVIGLAAVVSVTAAVFLTRFSGGNAVREGVLELDAAVQEVRRRSVTQQEGARWGIRFVNSTSTFHQYQVATTTTFGSSTLAKVGVFRNNLQFSEPPENTNLNIFFSAISGKYTTSTNKYVSLVRGTDGFVGDLLVTPLGKTLSRLRERMGGYFHFDEGAGTVVYDASGYNATGTVTGASWQAASGCKAGTCLSLDGSDYVLVPHSATLDLDNAFSVAAWAKPTALSGTQAVVVKWASGNYWFLRWSSSTLQFTPNADEASARVDYAGGTSGSWNHIAGTYDGTTGRLYLNGAQVASKSYSGGTNQNSGNVGIGAIVDGTPTQYFTGLIDEAQVYRQALSASSVEALYNELK